ncbi:PHD finger protein 11, partial [Eschrichtius robustus]|nr:PHD finger protein 11 [Eschrichtius robustus]
MLGHKLYSSALVECEDHDPLNRDRNFDVESVKKEIKRGRKLALRSFISDTASVSTNTLTTTTIHNQKCTYCGKTGATVGCDLKSCLKNYHFFCAKSDHAVLQADGSEGTYKVLCQQHADPQNDLLSVKPLSGVFHSHFSQQTEPKPGVGPLWKRLSSLSCQLHFVVPPERMALDRREKDGRHTDAIVKVAFLKKCKEAGLLNALFEEMLDRLHLIQERLMDETTSESDQAHLELEHAPQNHLGGLLKQMAGPHRQRF